MTKKAIMQKLALSRTIRVEGVECTIVGYSVDGQDELVTLTVKFCPETTPVRRLHKRKRKGAGK